MNTLQVRSKYDKSDIIKMTLYGFYGRSAFTAFVMTVTPIFLILLPTVFLLISALKLTFRPYLTVYVLSWWFIVYSDYKRIFKSERYGGVTEVYFTDLGIDVYTPVVIIRTPADNIKSCEESRHMFTIYTVTNESVTIMKRYLTLDEGMKIRTLFQQFLVRKGSFDDSAFLGERCEEAYRPDAETPVYEISAAADENFVKEAARCIFFRPAQLAGILAVAAMLGGILSTGFGDTFGIVFAVIYNIVRIIADNKKLQKRIRGNLEKYGVFTRVIFYQTHMEVYDENKIYRVPYGDITDIRARTYSTCIKWKCGGIFIPRNEEFLSYIKSIGINGGKV